MGLFSNLTAATKALPVAINGREVRPLASPAAIAQATGLNRWGLFNNSALELFPAENPKLLKAGYMDNHVVFTIADWKAQQFAKAPPILYEVKDDKSFRLYKSLTPLQKVDSYQLRHKAVEEVADPGDPLVALLAQPNPAQSWSELAYALSVYFDFGNALLYGIRLDEGLNKNQITELYLLPTSMYMGKNPGIAGYEYYLDSVGSGSQLPGSDVLHLRRFNADPMLQGGVLWGMSKLAPARRLLTKSNNLTEAEAELMQNRGAKAIIFPKGMPVDALPTIEQAELAGAAMREKLKSPGSGGIATNSIELGMIQLGMSAVDLDILQSNVGTKEDFCALWHLDANSIFSSTKVGSLGGNKQQEANKASLRSGVLPDLSLFYQKLNNFLLPAYNARYKYQRYIEPNTDVYPELQADKAEMMKWASQLVLSANARNELFGFARVDRPEMDIPLVPPGYAPISDFAKIDNEDDDLEPEV